MNVQPPREYLLTPASNTLLVLLILDFASCSVNSYHDYLALNLEFTSLSV